MNIKKLTKISLLAIIAALIMLFDFPLWFAPSFYKIDLSEVAVLIGGFALGPAAAVIIELLKVLLNLCINSTVTFGIGETANFIIGCAFTVPAAVIYKKHRTFKGAAVGMCVGTLASAIIGSLINAFVLLPVYAFAFGMDTLTPLISAGTQVNPAINGLTTFILFAVLPFNLLKCIISSVITVPLYKRVSGLLKK